MEEKLLTEKDLLEILGIKKSLLNHLRYNGLPFIKITSQCRAYLLSDIMAWAKEHRVVINRHENDTATHD